MLIQYAQAQGTEAGAVALTTWSDAITNSLQGWWIDFINFVPNFIIALVVFFVGWAVAVAIGRLAEKVLVVLRINQAFENLRGLREAASRAGLAVNIPHVIGEIVKWFLIIVFLHAAVTILRLEQVAIFLRDVLLYIPNVVVAAFILVIAVVLGNFVHRTVSASVSAAGFTSGPAVGAISKWAIVIFAGLAALIQLNVAASLIQTILTAFFAMLALAGGLAFGLGGKDMAAKWLGRLEADVVGRKK